MTTRRLLRTTVGTKFSEGARLLWLELQKRGCSQTDLASFLGASSALFNRWLWGDRRPELAWADRFARELGIPMGAWVQPPAKAFTPPRAIAATRRPPSVVDDEELREEIATARGGMR